MAQDAYFGSEIRSDGSHRIKPVVDPRIFEVEPDGQPVIRVLNKLMGAGGFKDVGDQKFTVQSQLPFRPQLTITGGASLTANTTGTITITEYTRIRKGNSIFLPLQPTVDLIVCADPTTSTVTVISSQTVVIAVQQGILGARNATEAWTSPSALGRQTGNYEDFISTVQDKCGISWHSAQTEMYGVNEWIRIQKDCKRRLDASENREIWTSFPRDGSSDPATYTTNAFSGSAFFRMMGLFYRGSRWNNNTCSGKLTSRFINRALYAWTKKHGIKQGISCYGSSNLVSELSNWGYTAGVNRRDVDSGTNAFGSAPATIRNPFGIQSLSIEIDELFDNLNMDDQLWFVCWPLIKAAKFGNTPYEIKPSSDVPEGSAARDTGSIAYTVTRTVGLYDQYPQGSVMCIKNITQGFEAA